MRESILDIIEHIKCKKNNYERVGDEYDKIKVIFEILEFPNVNKNYIENKEIYVDIKHYSSYYNY